MLIHFVDEEWWLGEAWLTAALFCHPARPKTQHTPSVKVKWYLITVLQIPARHLRMLKLNGLSVFSGWWCGVFLKVCKPTQTIKSFSVGHLCLKSVHSLPAIVRRIKKKQRWLRDCERAFYIFSRMLFPLPISVSFCFSSVYGYTSVWAKHSPLEMRSVFVTAAKSTLKKSHLASSWSLIDPYTLFEGLYCAFITHS